MTVTRVEVLSVEVNGGTSYKTGQPKQWEMRKAHCTIHMPEGKKVGIIVLPKDMADPAPGFYDAEFGITIDFKTQEVHGRLVSLQPVKAGHGITDAHIMGQDAPGTAADVKVKKAA